jgi:hypothetical protein
MEIDDRLNPLVIGERLVAIFNKNKVGDENYIYELSEGECIIYNIFGKKKECYKLTIPMIDSNGKYILLGGSNSNCSSSRGNGTRNLQNIIEFGKTYNYDKFMLINASRLDFKFRGPGESIEINLTILKILTIGNSWYSQFGFNNTNTLIIETNIKPIIQLTFEELSNRYSVVASKEYYPEQANECSDYIKRFVGLNRIKSTPECFKINESMTISHYFTQFQNCLFSICSEYTCESSYRTFIDIVKGFMNRIFVFIIRILEEGGFDVPQEETIDTVTAEYVMLELDLKEDTGLGKLRRPTKGRKTKRKSRKTSRKIKRKSRKTKRRKNRKPKLKF